MLVASQLLSHAAAAAAMSNTAAVAGLASAVTSLVKRAVQLIRASAALQAQSEAATDAAACFSPAICVIAGGCVGRTASSICDANASHIFAAPGAGSATGNNSQAAASAALLAVVHARSLVQLADAMEAAGPEGYFRSLLGKPLFSIRWLSQVYTGGALYKIAPMSPYGSEQQQTVEMQWQVWQLCVLRAMQHLLAALGTVGLAPPAPTAGDATAAAAAAAGSGGTGMAHASSGSRQVRWGYLLQLQQFSSCWAAAMAAYVAQQPNREEVAMGI
ncbi:hypothetical protein COO60DRAFT_244134 [Scenedesmus sp. NREL 46B-D3]|nr:hypothetical protein COO60DRAFT_244134 [Scenedesmus sp. NREL 46B-D3]